MGIGCVEIDKTLGVGVWQGVQKDGVYNAEDGDGGANAKGRHQKRDERKTGNSTKSAEFVSEIRRQYEEMLVERREGEIAAGFEPETPMGFVRKAACEDMLHFDAIFVAEFGRVATE
jgi:hypothetical protein